MFNCGAWFGMVKEDSRLSKLLNFDKMGKGSKSWKREVDESLKQYEVKFSMHQDESFTYGSSRLNMFFGSRL